ncbi:MAG TPA: hypothetical protein VFY10_11520 [Dehalococcoidia bacterium]|nr:hypothetical protein [Dehalococcoidia bacterium]
MTAVASNSSPRTIVEIVKDRVNTNENRAAECLVALAALSGDDPTLEDYRAAAQTFALLAIVDRIGYSGSGQNLTESIRAARGIQP